jgi:spore germination cell wall hydrolase CwlJ-like protein
MTNRLICGTILAIAAVTSLALSLGGTAERATAGSLTTNSSTLFSSTQNFIKHDRHANAASEVRCLALNVYWEARSEPVDGQIAVAAVTLNRANDPRFPQDVCSVVRDGGETRRHRCQFSWWCDGKQDTPLEKRAWNRAMMVARLVYAGAIADPTQGALWYHADYVEPSWAKVKSKTAQIGRHIFYVYPKIEDTEVSAISESDLAGTR